MRARQVLLVLTYFSLSSLAYAASVDVAVSADKSTIDIGEIGTLTVYGQVKPGSAVAGNGIFGWDVDLRVADPAIVQVLAATLVRDAQWTQQALTSSSGTAQPWGIDAIYDTGEGSSSLGLSAPIRLFSVQFTGLAVGDTTLTVQPDLTTGADFVTWLNNSGGDYTNASVPIHVPEPATLGLLGLGAVALLRRRR